MIAHVSSMKESSAGTKPPRSRAIEKASCGNYMSVSIVT
jgi:hypothetical protein